MMHGGHHHLHTDRISCGSGGVWRFREDGAAGAAAARMQTVFWERMEIDIATSCSERVCSPVDVRVMVVHNGRDEVRVYMYVHREGWSTWGVVVGLP